MKLLLVLALCLTCLGCESFIEVHRRDCYSLGMQLGQTTKYVDYTCYAQSANGDWYVLQ